MITEGTRQSGSVRFRLNGQVKTVNHPITGAILHVLAGNPTSLTMGGREIPNSSEQIDLKEDQELTSEHTPGANLPGTVAEKPLTEAERKEQREARLDEVAAGHGGPYGQHPKGEPKRDAILDEVAEGHGGPYGKDPKHKEK